MIGPIVHYPEISDLKFKAGDKVIDVTALTQGSHNWKGVVVESDAGMVKVRYENGAELWKGYLHLAPTNDAKSLYEYSFLNPLDPETYVLMIEELVKVCEKCLVVFSSAGKDVIGLMLFSSDSYEKAFEFLRPHEKELVLEKTLSL